MNKYKEGEAGGSLSQGMLWDKDSRELNKVASAENFHHRTERPQLSKEGKDRKSSCDQLSREAQAKNKADGNPCTQQNLGIRRWEELQAAFNTLLPDTISSEQN